MDLVFVCRSKTTCFSCEHGNWLGLCDGGRNCLDVRVGDRTWLDFSVGMEFVWLLCELSKMTLFQCAGTALIWFLFSGRKWLVFSVRIEIYWVFVSWHRNRLDIGVGNKIDLISVIGSKLTWFSCAGSKLTWFYRWDQTRLFFVRGSKSTSVLCVDRK